MNDRVTAVENKLKELEDRIKALEPKKVEVVVPSHKSKKVSHA